jgi:hypothetical protein
LLWPATAGLAVGLALAGYGVMDSPEPPPQPPVTGSSRPVGTPPPAAADVPALGFSPPVRIDVGRLGIHAGVLDLGLNDDGTVAVPRPEEAGEAGWYDGSSAPGQKGPAVLLGHVDSARLPGGRAVFYRLGQARPGDRVDVRRADGITARFTVDEITTVPKDHFPTQSVYGPTRTPELRLITCGGAYTAKAGYAGNVVVYAHYTGRGLDTD